MRFALALSVAIAVPLASVGCKKSSTTSADGGAAAGSASPAGSGAGLSILSGFEGEIDVVAKGGMGGKNGAPQNLAVLVKSDKVRLDIPEGLGEKGGPSGAGGKSWVIYDAPAKKLMMVNDAQKQAIVLDLNQKDALKMSPLGGGKPGAGSSPPPKITKTGKKDSVAGYTCEEWEISNDKNEKGTLCVASEGASWFHLPSLGLPTEHAWMSELLDGKHFPLRFVDLGTENKEKGRIEVTKIDKKALQPSQFEVPAGYKVMDLGQMFQHGIPGMPSGLPTHPHMPH